MNRAARRQAERSAVKPSLVSPLCPSGHHAFARLAGTVAGDEVAVRVVCTECRRPFEQVMEEQPEELARYRAFLESEGSDA